MKLDSKNSFSKGERAVILASVSMGNAVYKVRNKDRYKTVYELLKLAEVDVNSVSDEVKRIFDHKVSQVCRSGSRFTKDCICVQLYDDGPEVLRWAMQNGALICVARYQIDDYPCIVTDNPAAIYARMCATLRNKTVDSVAITGSIGKTTAKKMIYSMYRAQLKTFCDAGNDNQLDGVGYIAQHIPKKSKIWVQEVSEDTPGSITDISRIIEPRIAVITAIDKSHIEEFGNEEGILREIHSIVDYMPEDGIIITSIDDKNTANLISERKVISVSLYNSNADFYAKSINIKPDGLKYSIVQKSTGIEHQMTMRYVYAEHNIYAALYAFACGVISGVDITNIKKGIEQYRASGIRQNVYSDKGVTIYADCYNAVAKSVRSAVQAAEKIPVNGKRIAVIGDIAETGDFTESTHNELIDIVNNSNFEILIAYGVNTCVAAKHFNCRGNLKVICCDDRSSLNKSIKENVKRGDLVLFKASHSTGLEKSLRKCFPKSCIIKTLEYYWPQLTWRLKVLLN